MTKINEAVQDMYIQHNAYIHIPIHNQSDPPQQTNNDENMEELTPEEKLQRFYLTELDTTIDHLVSNAKMQSRAPFHENEAVLNYLTNAIHDAFNAQSEETLGKPNNLCSMSFADHVEKNIDTYYGRARTILLKKLRNRKEFVKNMKEGNYGYLLKATAVKLFCD
jgi:hypothetical protein